MEKIEYYNTILMISILASGVAHYFFKLNIDKSIIINVIIGIIAFVSIFYSFVLKKEIVENKNKILERAWKNKKQEITKNMRDLIKQFNKKSNISHELMLADSEKIYNSLEEFLLIKQKNDINKKLAQTITFLMLSLIIFIDVILTTNSVFASTYPSWYSTLENCGILTFWIGIYKSCDLVIIWHSIVKD